MVLNKYFSLNKVFIDEVEGVNRRNTKKAGGEVCNFTLSLRLQKSDIEIFRLGQLVYFCMLSWRKFFAP